MRLQHWLSWLLIVGVLGIGGCNLLPHIAYIAGGTMVPAQFKGLEDSRVAVVCVSDDSSYGSGTESERLARGVAMIGVIETIPEFDLYDNVAFGGQFQKTPMETIVPAKLWVERRSHDATLFNPHG